MSKRLLEKRLMSMFVELDTVEVRFSTQVFLATSSRSC